jgi:hypothetical protein
MIKESVDWVAVTLHLSLLISAVAFFLLAMSFYWSMKENVQTLPYLKWKQISKAELENREVLKGFLVSLMILVGSTQVAYVALSYFEYATRKDAYEYLSFASPAEGALIVGLGLLAEHNKLDNVMQLAVFRYYFYSVLALSFGYIGYVASHPVPGLYPWISCTLGLLLLRFGWVRAVDAALRGKTSGLIRMSGFIFMAAAVVAQAAFWFFFTSK